MFMTTDEDIAKVLKNWPRPILNVPLTHDEQRRGFIRLCVMNRDKTVQQILDMVEYGDVEIKSLIEGKVTENVPQRK